MIEAKVGLAGSGLTEQCIQRFLHLFDQTHQSDRILIIVRNQRQVLDVKHRILAHHASWIGPLHIYTFITFVKQTLTHYWALIRQHEPTLPLTLEPSILLKDLTQYLLLKTCELCPQHANIFKDSGLRPYQIWDQISSAAYIAGSSGIPPGEISLRLIEAWPDLEDENRTRQLGALSCCIKRLRDQSLHIGSLEFGTLLELFQREILPLADFWGSFDHLIVDQIEDSSAVALDFYKQATEHLQSVFVTYTIGGGASQTSVPNLVGQFVTTEMPTTILRTHFKSSSTWAYLGIRIAETLDPDFNHPFDLPIPDDLPEIKSLEGDTQLECIEHMIADIKDRLAQGVDPSQIAIIAPKLEAPLVLSLQNWLKHRILILTAFPALIKYPLIRALLTLAELAHPDWMLFPLSSDLTTLFTTFLTLDPIRADLLAQDVLDPLNRCLRPYSAVRSPERVGFANLQAYQRLLDWLETYHTQSPLSIHAFLRKVLIDLLPTSALTPVDQRLVQTLIETARRFCQDLPDSPSRDLLMMLRSGITLSPSAPPQDDSGSLVVATPIDYINRGLGADYHYWFDLTSSAWSRSRWRALYNPHVLTPEWNRDLFGEDQEHRYQSQILANTVLNLACRIRENLVLVSSSFNSRGENNMGTLHTRILKACQL